MTVAVGEILKIVAVMSWLDGDILQNVFNLVVGSGGGPFDNQDVLDDMVDWLDDMYANLTASVSDELDGSECRVYRWDPIDSDWDEVGTELFTWNPSDVNEQLPRGVAGLINAKTTDPDVNGKKYLGGITEAWADDGIWGGAEIATFVLFAVDWLQSFVGAASGATFDPGIWSPTQETLFEMSGTALVPAIPAYQRRRKQGVGI